MVLLQSQAIVTDRSCALVYSIRFQNLGQSNARAFSDSLI